MRRCGCGVCFAVRAWRVSEEVRVRVRCVLQLGHGE